MSNAGKTRFFANHTVFAILFTQYSIIGCGNHRAKGNEFLSQVQSQIRPKKRDSIQLFRGIACLGVLIVHLGQRLQLSGTIGIIADFAKYGVYPFFIISGYLTYESGDLRNGKWKKYWVKPAIKILPPYFLSIAYFFVTETFVYQDVPVDAAGLGWLRYVPPLAGNVYSPTYFGSNLGITRTIFVFAIFYPFVPFTILS